MPPLEVDKSEEDTEGAPLLYTDDSEVNPYADMPPLEEDKSEEDTESAPPLYTDDSEEDTGYGENEDSDNLNVWIENISSHNTEIDNFIQAAFALSTNDSPDMMEQLDVHPPLSQEGCEDDQRDRRKRQPEMQP